MALAPPDVGVLRDERKLLDLLRGLVRAANRSEHITGGPGVEIHRTVGGVGIAVKARKVERSAPGEAVDDTGGELQTLSNVPGTKDTDEWNRQDGRPLLISVITDVGWDSAGGNIVGRFRQLRFDKAGKLEHVSVESDWVVLIPTESCSQT